jgi:polysaccharide biosynthesis transport protein
MTQASDKGFPPQLEYAPAPSSGSAIDGGDIVRALRRSWWAPVCGCLIGLALGSYYIVSVPAPYKSSARILLDRSSEYRYLQANRIADAPSLHDPEIGSQVYVLSSDSVVVPVVRSMKLAYDSEFVGPPKTDDSYINKLKEFVKQSIGWNTTTAAIDPETLRERTAVEGVVRRLTVHREDVANVINVTFESGDALKAASIANAIADTYVATTLEAKVRSSKVAGEWLRDRLTELKAQTMEADRALQNYKIAHSLGETGKGSLDSEQLSTLNVQLITARVALAESKARLDRIHEMAASGGITTAGITTAALMDAFSNNLAGKTGAVNFALQNSDIVRLRTQYRDLAARAAEIEPRVQPGHLVLVKLRQQMDDLRAAIQEEERRIADSYAHEYELAKARERDLAARAAETLGKAETNSQAQVTIRELESSADTLRNLHNSFLEKLKGMDTIQTQMIPVENARIITRAVPQWQRSSKKGLAVFGGSIMLGLFLGVGAAIGREWLADVFRTSKAVEQATYIPCVVLPKVKAKPRVKAKRERAAGLRGSTKSMPIEEFVLDAPFSRFAETLRNVKALIDAAPQVTQGAKVIGVVSSVPKEGKTTIAANLAALLIASSGARTLLIDADLHMRLLTAALAPDAREGLIEALVDPSRLATLVAKRPGSGLDVLPCAIPSRVPNAAELLGSPQMEQLLVAARKAYDYIIIEIAPIMSVVDIKMIERFIDNFIFVVEWGVTKRGLVLEALSEAHGLRERLVGIVLNKADPSALRSIEAYKGNRFRDYYEE